MTKFKITQEILDYISEHNANFSEVTPSPTLGEEWIVKGIKTYPNVNNGNSVVEAEREDGCYTRLPEKIVKIYTIDKEQTSKFDLQEEPVSEELGDYINELSKQFPEVSFAKLSRIAVRVAKWQKEQMMNGAVEVQVNNDPLVGRYINMSSSVVLDTLNQLNSDKAKLIIIKED